MAGVNGRGRPASMESKLGRMIKEREMLAYRVAAECGFSSRIMTEYCAGRRIIRPGHLDALCRFFRVMRHQLIEDDLLVDVTSANGLVLPNAQGIHNVKELKEYKREQAAKEARTATNLPTPPTSIPAGGIPTSITVAGSR